MEANKEKRLRELMKEVMGSDVNWIEPAFGSTVGRPDADFNIDGKLIPIELKWWEHNRKGLKREMRPAQIRYHIMSARNHMRTAILFGCQRGDHPEIGFIAGKNCPKQPYEVSSAHYIFMKRWDDNREKIKIKIKEILSNELFWQEGNK